MKKIRNIAIIPARGGSKRIPLKNIKEFDGKPMIAWTIEAAKEAGIFDRIIVSTDSEEIAKVAIQCGAEVPFLRNTAADDHAPVSEATLATIMQLEQLDEKYDRVYQLFSVSPLRNAQDILDAERFFESKNADFLLSCFKYAWMNPWWAVKLDEKNQPEWIFEDAKKRSQDLPELYCPTGAIWVANIEALKRDKTFYGKGHIFWEMPWQRALDIDNYEDIQLGLALKYMNKKD